ncbi:MULTISPECIES: class II aldolase/adducin family protein [Rhizobium]|uniref:class II aldolase/adducin family protein n=1 Tax=Rhizobium TaxID=379 RepID=UPI0002A71796|nr:MULTISPECIES: class II aldolase/adducin family protein [Rhizobium]AGB75015.1 class II aldolase/adducin family protein [Rhizobium tropici CIAT 899]MBB4243041.1 rhamnose utilization protein RhaD (predicted bifunctional aldolase and dehydrogenase) [Rhizobium tropici]
MILTVAPRGSDGEFDRFLALSKEIGADILKTQGAGGNTSLKDGDMMWVKASGTWLAQAGDRDIMVPVRVTPLVEALRQGDPRAEKATDFIVGALNTSGLRPSIETSFHAALTNRVVAHYHCVNAIALSVLAQRDEILKTKLDAAGMKWATTPYRRPGTPLAREVDHVAADKPDVLILYNHGIIVTGETVEEVSGRIEQVTAALEVPVRQVSQPDIKALQHIAEGSSYAPASDEASHQLALSPENIRIATGGSMYPDHVIFLGTKIGLLEAGQLLQAYLESFDGTEGGAPKMIIVPGSGVLVSNALTPGGQVMVRCLAEVVSRIPDGADVVYLSQADEYELTNWEAEQYRQALDRGAAKS